MKPTPAQTYSKTPAAPVSEDVTYPIDYDFDVEFVDQMARIESYNKHLYRPNTYLHKWWARRCGSTFRAILKHLVADEAQRDYYAPGGLAGKIILDPMMGGGTTLHEAIRLNANVIGADIDPIPVLQARASLNDVAITELTMAFDELIAHLKADLGDLYQVDCACGKLHPIKYTLHGLNASCHCRQVTLIDSLTLRHNSDDSCVRLDPRTRAVYLDRQLIATSDLEHPQRLMEKIFKRCPRCRKPYREDRTIPYYQRYEPLVTVFVCPKKGLQFVPATALDRERIARAEAMRAELGFDSAEFTITPGPKSDNLHVHGVDNYLDVFSARQLLFLRSAINAIRPMAPEVRLNLALLISTSLEFNSMLCGYKGALKSRPGAVRHTFTRHAYIFPYTALESNPLFPQRTSGTLRNLFTSRILRGRNWASNPVERVITDDIVTKFNIVGETDLGTEVTQFDALTTGSKQFMLLQGSSAELDLPADSVDFIVTDPPYFDSVQYGDLAAYFHVWLRQLLPDDANWDYDLANAAVDQHANGNGQYSSVLSAIFAECRRVLKPDGRLIFTYHHRNPKGWAALTTALQYAGFILVNRYVVHSESPTSIHIANQQSLQHDVILVLRPKQAERRHDWQLPAIIDAHDSRVFCEGCGVALGAMLESNLSIHQIQLQWQQLLA